MNQPEDIKTNDKNWKRFIHFCEADRIGLEYREDWEPWWKCWKAGYMSAFQDANEQNERIQKRPGEY